MILPDVNILLYAYDISSRSHAAASEWLENVLSNEEVFFSWHTITAFLRLITHPGALAHPTTIDHAVSIVEEWLQLDNTHIVGLDKRMWPVFANVLIEGQATGNLVMDAHLAALAKSCGAVVATTDRDFRRFTGISITDPLSPA